MHNIVDKSGEKMSSAISVADEILKIAKRKGMQLTPLQLMKLVYISHGWAFPILGKDLFSNRIEAWKFGPVIPDLYHATKHYGRNTIPHSDISDNPSTGFDSTILSFLEDVLDKYGHLDGFSLSNLTHQTGTPWDQVFDESKYNVEIPDSLIKQHYQAKFDEFRQQQSSAS